MNSRDGIIGLAIGDAMGVPLKFMEREKLLENPVTDMTDVEYLIKKRVYGLRVHHLL